jgi:hypothetical protein
MLLVLRGDDAVKHYPYSTDAELRQAAYKIVQTRYLQGVYPEIQRPDPKRPKVREHEADTLRNPRLRGLVRREWRKYRADREVVARWSDIVTRLRKSLRDRTGKLAWDFLQTYQDHPSLGYDLVEEE